VKRGRRQRKADEQRAAEAESWDQENEQSPEASAADLDETGWKTCSAHMSVIARLVRVGAWALVASGPVFGVTALLGSPSPAQGVAKPATSPTPASSTGPAGFAQLFVAAYLEAGQGTERELAPYYSGPVALSAKPGTREVTRSTVVASREVQPGYWSITVAADVTAQDDKGKANRLGVQYFRVGVQAKGPAAAGGTAKSVTTGAGYAATSLPAQVSAPAALKPGALKYESDRGTSSADPSVETAKEFLSAYLTGTAELDRYTSPSVPLRAITPAPYTAVKVTGVKDDSSGPGQQKVPADGTELHQLVEVEATDQAGNDTPLSYALTLRSRASRWEVASIDDAPALRAGSAPSAAPHTTTPETPAATPSPSGP